MQGLTEEERKPCRLQGTSCCGCQREDEAENRQSRSKARGLSQDALKLQSQDFEKYHTLREMFHFQFSSVQSLSRVRLFATP